MGRKMLDYTSDLHNGRYNIRQTTINIGYVLNIKQSI